MAGAGEPHRGVRLDLAKAVIMSFLLRILGQRYGGCEVCEEASKDDGVEMHLSEQHSAVAENDGAKSSAIPPAKAEGLGVRNIYERTLNQGLRRDSGHRSKRNSRSTRQLMKIPPLDHF